MNIVRQCLRTGGFDGLQTIGQDGTQDIHHLAITAGLAFQLALDPSDCRRQIPFPERRAIAQSARLVDQGGGQEMYRDVWLMRHQAMRGVDRIDAATEWLTEAKLFD